MIIITSIQLRLNTFDENNIVPQCLQKYTLCFKRFTRRYLAAVADAQMNDKQIIRMEDNDDKDTVDISLKDEHDRLFT